MPNACRFIISELLRNLKRSWNITLERSGSKGRTEIHVNNLSRYILTPNSVRSFQNIQFSITAVGMGLCAACFKRFHP
jgi:hypothetical protein